MEPPPFFGRDEREPSRCATAAVAMAEREQDMTAMQLTVDGQRVADLAAYRAVTPRFTLWFPEDNLMGVEITIPAPRGEEPTVVSYRLRVDSSADSDTTGSPVASPSS